jgi:hypothetical protein
MGQFAHPTAISRQPSIRNWPLESLSSTGIFDSLELSGGCAFLEDEMISLSERVEANSNVPMCHARAWLTK